MSSTSNTKVPVLMWMTSISFLLLPLLVSLVNADCYNPNGTNRNIGAPDVASGTEAYFPCNTVQPYSMCCRSTDKCLANGLCEQGGTNLWRESCTDQSWRSTICLKLCVDENESDEPVKQCPDQSFCCNGANTNATQCCEQGTGLWIVDGEVTNKNPNATSSSSSSSSTSSSSTSSPTATATATATILNSPAKNTAPAPSSHSSGGGTNTSAIAGGVVGGVVALGILLGGAVVLLRRRKRRREENAGQNGGAPPMQGYYPSAPGEGIVKRPIGAGFQEVEGASFGGRRELDGVARSEMEAGGVKR